MEGKERKGKEWKIKEGKERKGKEGRDLSWTAVFNWNKIR